MPALQYWFSGAALAAFLALVGTAVTLGYGWYRAAVTEMQAALNKTETAAERALRDEVKALLGKAVASGNQLVREMKDKEDAQAVGDAEAWGQRTRDLVVAAYGEGEGDLFLDNSGYVFYSDASEKSKVRNWIDGRLRRLTEQLQRTDRLNVRKGFILHRAVRFQPAPTHNALLLPDHSDRQLFTWSFVALEVRFLEDELATRAERYEAGRARREDFSHKPYFYFR